MNPLRRFRLGPGLSQPQFAARLGIAEQTYRTWDSGRRTPPRAIVMKARRLAETDGGRLLPLLHLADEFGIHVRTLRKAAQDGRLAATFSARMAFGSWSRLRVGRRLMRSDERTTDQTTQWNRPARPAVCVAPADYDQVLVSLRTRLRLTQAGLAEHVGASNKAVVYQWESRRRRPSPMFWKRVVELAGSASAPSSPGCSKMPSGTFKSAKTRSPHSQGIAISSDIEHNT